MSRLSVIVPSYENPLVLMRCLRSLVLTRNNPSDYAIIVQDDNSLSFDSADIEALVPTVSVGRNYSTSGFAGNCNRGAERARSDILLFLNQDTVAHTGWLGPLMKMFENTAIGIVGPKLVFPNRGNDRSRPPGRIQSCGGAYDKDKGPFHIMIGAAADDPRINVDAKVSWTTGAALAIRSGLFRSVGGFNEEYGLGYFEDVELCERAKLNGFEVWYCCDSVFDHAVASTGGIPTSIFRANSKIFHDRWDHYIVADVDKKVVDY